MLKVESMRGKPGRMRFPGRNIFKRDKAISARTIINYKDYIYFSKKKFPNNTVKNVNDQITLQTLNIFKISPAITS